MCMAGMLPLARELLRRGTVVVLIANERASINDITATELRNMLNCAAKSDMLLARCVAEQALTVVSSGNDTCVIDLRQV